MKSIKLTEFCETLEVLPCLLNERVDHSGISTSVSGGEPQKERLENYQTMKGCLALDRIFRVTQSAYPNLTPLEAVAAYENMLAGSLKSTSNASPYHMEILATHATRLSLYLDVIKAQDLDLKSEQLIKLTSTLEQARKAVYGYFRQNAATLSLEELISTEYPPQQP